MLTHVRQEISAFLSPFIGKSAAEISNSLEIPKKLEHGHLAFPIFSLAKELRKAPPLIAQDLTQKMLAQKPDFIKTLLPAGGYINFTLKDDYLQNVLLQAVHSQGEKLGHSQLGQGRKIVIDYSSPNVAKPMHIGHLRATVIGQSIRNLLESQGFAVIGLNHLGDWGTQFGKLAWALKNWGHEYPFKEEPIESLLKMYVRFHELAENDPKLEAEGAATFKKLEDGDKEITALWHQLVDLSMTEYKRLWQMLGVKHDMVLGESFYNDKLKATEALLEQKGLLVESEGAMVVMLGDDMPPALIRKSDGASLYATRDLASAIYRMEVLKADLSLYVVGEEQNLHFKQIFQVLEKLGFAWAKNCHHITFGRYRFKDGQMSTRKGKVVLLEDVLKQAIDRVDKIIEEKNPTLPERRKTAEQVGIGAIVFNDLVNDRLRGVDFDWERVLDFEGTSGPYVQYCHVRCVSVLKKFAEKGTTEFALPKNMPLALTSAEERELIRLLLSFPDVLTTATQSYRPNVVAQYLLDVCQVFNHFYAKHRILGEASDVQIARLSLVYVTKQILRLGLQTLNMAAPDAM